MSKVIVVSEKGKLVGTSISLQQPPQPGAPFTRLVSDRNFTKSKSKAPSSFRAGVNPKT